MKYNWIIILVGLLISSNILSQIPDLVYQKYIYDSLAVIQDKEGFTNVREEPDINSKIIFQINTFYIFKIVAKNGNNWGEIENIANGQSGYMHSSKIRNLGSLSDLEIKELSIHILDSMLILMHSRELYSDHDYTIIFKDYYHFQLFPVLNLVSKYYCNTQDKGFLNYYLDFMIEVKGTAWEATLDALTEIFECKADDVITELSKRSNYEKEYFIEVLEGKIGSSPNKVELLKILASIKEE
jgi:hypothetical protein